MDSLIDETSIYSNDIYAILRTYGVEAARAAILQEVKGVFDVYKIDVDIRHLELIADYMVCSILPRSLWTCLIGASDLRRGIQALQSLGYLDEPIATTEGIIRDHRLVHL